jgi:hypothetical protein
MRNASDAPNAMILPIVFAVCKQDATKFRTRYTASHTVQCLLIVTS